MDIQYEDQFAIFIFQVYSKKLLYAHMDNMLNGENKRFKACLTQLILIQIEK